MVDFQELLEFLKVGFRPAIFLDIIPTNFAEFFSCFCRMTVTAAIAFLAKDHCVANNDITKSPLFVEFLSYLC